MVTKLRQLTRSIAGSTPQRVAHAHRGFTLIELLVVLAVVALMLTLAVPRYYGQVDNAKETVLRDNLRTMRDVLDQFRGDTGRYPESLEELVEKHYLRSLPSDPITDSASTWIIVAPPKGHGGSVYDIKSGATGISKSGQAFADM